MRIRNLNHRRGITLLFVVSMIVLFLLMGTAFVVVANEFLRGSKTRQRVAINNLDGTGIVERALFEILRGPALSNTSSPLRGMDLLSDMYGYGFKGQIEFTPTAAKIPATLYFNTPLDSGGQFIELQLKDDVTLLRTGATAQLSATDAPDAYNGNILTFVSGPATGISTRIVDYQIIDVGGTITRKFIIAPDWSDAGAITLDKLLNSYVIVNGRAFGGFGAGAFDATKKEGTAALSAEALKPNRVGETLADLTNDITGYLGDNLGPNESYDAPDFQNPFLSGYDKNGKVLASFYRESIGNNQKASTANRGSFAAFDKPRDVNVTTDNVYEVDSDNDGIKDAIWMDLGYQIQTNKNGIHYKPLVAFRIVDLDGRLNLNLAGNLADMYFRDYTTPPPVPPTPFFGQGYGPADISLSGFFGTANGTITDYEKLLRGFKDTTNRLIVGRYGLGLDNDIQDIRSNNPSVIDEVPGSAIRDPWSVRKTFGYPTGANYLGGFYASSPLDVRGRFEIANPNLAYDPNLPAFNSGLPQVNFSTAMTGFDEFQNSPYESSFAPRPYKRLEQNDDDQPFLAEELQALLRPFDVDSSMLPNRLRTLLGSIASDPIKRKSVTTDSFEVPMAPYYANDSTGRTRNLVQLLREKMKAEPINASKQAYEFERQLRDLLSPEVLMGLKMDINRPFGNGIDDNNDGVIDDPDESFSVQNNLDPTLNVQRKMDLNNDFVAGTNDDLARYEFAKHLYVLTLLVTEDQALGTLSLLDYRKAVAQWAINVVDFRDPDSINTPFEFDLNPWNGWDPTGTDGIDGRINEGEMNSGDRWVVWGMERPELLITETQATHDRRLEDLPTPNKKTTDTNNPDPNFDQRLVPQTSFFVELYHPWTQDTVTNQKLPAELTDNKNNPTGISLNRVAPGGDPVWRLGVKRAPTDVNFLRSIYFSDINAGTPATNDVSSGEVFFTSRNNVPAIQPGRSAVIGSSGTSTDGPNGRRTTFGRLRNGQSPSPDPTPDDLNKTRSITLDPNASQVKRNEFVGGAMQTRTTNAVAVVIDSPRSLSISDPNGGYTPGQNNVGDGMSYNPVKDAPLDDLADPLDLPAIWSNGTTPAFRTLYLQRLANPLLAWNKDTNPYLTVDVSPVNLLAFNGAIDNADNGPSNKESAINAVNVIDTDASSLERGESQQTATTARALFARDNGKMQKDKGKQTNDGHNFGFNLEESLGQINDAYVNAPVADSFAWLTWNNRPFVSQFELANVPFTSQEQLTAAFSMRDQATFNNPYDVTSNSSTNPDPTLKLGSQFGHLLNFHGVDLTSNPSIGNFYRLFDYTEVPSRYVGTETWLNPSVFTNHPFNSISQFRYPGKINLNTIPNQDVFKALLGPLEPYATDLTYAKYKDSLWTTNHFRPYRNATEGNFVPPAVPVEQGVDTGLFRRMDPASDTNSIFDLQFQHPLANTDRSAYFRNAIRQRLANLTTTRSSVFAIWVTVGYFEVDTDGKLKTEPDLNNVEKGIEIGADSGTAVRNRGFCIFDRSIPVAFEPGKNHNIERAILVKTIIE